MTAWYNEHDPYAAQWLRNPIAAGLIAPGDVDERDIRDVTPQELVRYDQCHFFAGIGTWSYALRLARWPDRRPVWTGSCPCQPFSAAGRGLGFADERHLWPEWFRLIAQCRPGIVLGEQVASRDGLGWLDLVHADLEGAGYAVGAVDLCAAGVGAPHIRQRLWFVAHAHGAAGKRHARSLLRAQAQVSGAGLAHGHLSHGPADGCAARGALADTDVSQRRPQPAGRPDVADQPHARREKAAGRSAVDRKACIVAASAGERHDGRRAGAARVRHDEARREPERFRGARSVADAHGGPRHEKCANPHWRTRGGCEKGRAAGSVRGGTPRRVADPHESRACCERSQCRGQLGRAGRDPGAGALDAAGPANGFWRAADWIGCRDGRFRPVEPGTFPLAHGATARVGRLRAYGNAVVAEAAATFIRAADEALNALQANS
ncbi:Modification methylase AplI [Burkholderia multivorans]|nr:Modification methylase AplI [Burkholderia multivorans]MDR8769015.1 Modification methylase AplI [Burkholderia multivorans]MDR8774984.1 Modification methylase AplI [Burkholderia multivorans]MDR8792541.1 Modification methylase AplI [Burkholderia multivorans]MDR8798600.1 Modification methylase AplI [Burkholderia multivorans]